MDLAALRRKKATFTVAFDDDTVTIEYNPHKYDDKCQEILADLSEQKNNTELAYLFERLFVSWDMRDNGKEVPCTAEGFLMAPPFLRTKILNDLINDEMEVGKLRGSDSGSNRTAAPVRSGLVPIGTSDGPRSNGQD